MNKEFGNLLKKFRMDKNVLIRDLADAIWPGDLPGKRVRYSDVENGRTLPLDTHEMARACTALSLTGEECWLLGIAASATFSSWKEPEPAKESREEEAPPFYGTSAWAQVGHKYRR